MEFLSPAAAQQPRKPLPLLVADKFLLVCRFVALVNFALLLFRGESLETAPLWFVRSITCSSFLAGAILLAHTLILRRRKPKDGRLIVLDTVCFAIAFFTVLGALGFLTPDI